MNCTLAGTGNATVESNHTQHVSGEDSAGDSGPADVSFLETMVAVNNLLWWFQHECEAIQQGGRYVQPVVRKDPQRVSVSDKDPRELDGGRTLCACPCGGTVGLGAGALSRDLLAVSGGAVGGKARG